MTSQPTRRLTLASLLACSLLTCRPGSWITVELEIAAGQTPFLGVQTVRLTVSGPGMADASAAVGYQRGAELELPPVPAGPGRVITVEGIDSEGAILARGVSAQPFEVTADGPERVRVPFAACTSTLYRDADGDGHGNRSRGKRACPAAGWVELDDDCNDEDKGVYPGQTQYFGAAQQPGGSSKPFDYNCDGAETPKLGTNQVACVKIPSGCDGAGWRTSAPPCGGSDTYVECQKQPPDCAEGVSQTIQQTCH